MKDTLSVPEGTLRVVANHRLFLARLTFALDHGDLLEVGTINHNDYFKI
jgi:hypothetical protein